MSLQAQPMRVVLTDGRRTTVCCGPAVPTDAVAYWPVGASREGLCCHTGGVRDAEVRLLHLNESEWDAVRRALNPATRGTS